MAAASAPGAANGITWLGTRWPALPTAQPPSIGPWSTTVTCRPATGQLQRAGEPDDPAADHDDIAVRYEWFHSWITVRRRVRYVAVPWLFTSADDPV